MVADAELPSWSATSTIPPGGLQRRALSSRFDTARLMRSGSPVMIVGSICGLEAHGVAGAALGALDLRADDEVEAHVVE